ncbi:hypothetical protein [Pseudorhizobium flavum]|uniref:Uncharacterized protein n=1 Tax=Pseudorhizobium flavum TaxID=1335061 RepID=A0A7X0DCQ2_9HYPH|nr:hypothetical protein [Pseudorhizobium flavum]MBB6179987.1 hypothetical protein [Pseudorhizobium flavum]
MSAKDRAGLNTIGGTANALAITTDRDYPEYEDALFLTFKADSDIAGAGLRSTSTGWAPSGSTRTLQQASST